MNTNTFNPFLPNPIHMGILLSSVVMVFCTFFATIFLRRTLQSPKGRGADTDWAVHAGAAGEVRSGACQGLSSEVAAQGGGEAHRFLPYFAS